MENHSKAKTEFDRKLEELKKEEHPVLYGNNLKDLVIYEKLLEMQEQLNRLSDRVEKK